MQLYYRRPFDNKLRICPDGLEEKSDILSSDSNSFDDKGSRKCSIIIKCMLVSVTLDTCILGTLGSAGTKGKGFGDVNIGAVVDDR
jgi:hypothetical protein